MSKMKLRDVYIVSITLGLITAMFAAPSLAQEASQASMTIQPQQPRSEGWFGYSVAINGDFIVVGEPHADVEGESRAGLAYLYDTEGGLVTTLRSPSPVNGNIFGWSVDITENIIAVSAMLADADGVREAGKAYIFDTDGDLKAALQAPQMKLNGLFGISVAASGDIVVVGEHDADAEGISCAGRVHMYDSDGHHLRSLQSPNPVPTGKFGLSVDVHGDIIVVGEVTTGNEVVGPGSVYVFNTAGDLLATMESPVPDESLNFGGCVAVDDEFIVVGESFANVDGITKAGKAYVFDTEGHLKASLQSPTPETNAEFGCSVAMDGDTILIGEHQADLDVVNEGRAYKFDIEGNLLEILQAPNPSVNEKFGASAAIYGDISVVGGPMSTVEGMRSAGRTYIFGGKTLEAEAESVPQEVSQPDTATDEKPSGIPGFRYASIIVGLAAGTLLLWIIQKR
jgi:outer membrane protein assembly factor BamB